MFADLHRLHHSMHAPAKCCVSVEVIACSPRRCQRIANPGWYPADMSESKPAKSSKRLVHPNSALLAAPRGWAWWATALFVVVFALGFAQKALSGFRFFDIDIALNSVNSPLFDRIALAFDKLDTIPVVAGFLAVTFVVVALTLNWRIGLGVCAATGLGWITTLVVKTVVAMPRPTGDGISHSLDVSPATLSYPSGHVVFIAALVTALALVVHSRWMRFVVIGVGALVVLITMWSRLYAGVHYPADVVGGVLNGVAGVLLFAGLWNIVAARIWRVSGKHRH